MYIKVRRDKQFSEQKRTLKGKTAQRMEIRRSENSEGKKHGMETLTFYQSLLRAAAEKLETSPCQRDDLCFATILGIFFIGLDILVRY